MTKSLGLLLAASVWYCVCAAEATAQPVLNRVEKLLREQLGTPGTGKTPNAEPGYLGLVADDSPDGVRVLDLAPEGPAAQGGVQRGDLIKSVDGKAVRVMDDLAQELEGKPQGARLSLTVQRGSAQQRKTITLGKRPATRPTVEELPGPKLGGPPLPPPDPQAVGPRLGVRTLPVTAEVARKNKLPDTKGAVVVAIASGSAAELAGVPMGAVIVGVDDQNVNSPQELADAIRGANPEGLDLTYYHQGDQIRQKVSFDDSPGPISKVEAKESSVEPPQPDSELAGGPDLAAANKARIEALEARIAELEARLKQLEAKQPPTPQP
jgi:S1-C subfamily serine protease